MCESSSIVECQGPYPKIREESFPIVIFFNQNELESTDIMLVSDHLNYLNIIAGQSSTELESTDIMLVANTGFSYVSVIYNCLHAPPPGLGSKLVIILIYFAWKKCMFCLQMSLINLDFKKPFSFWWPWNPGIFQKAMWPRFDGLRNQSHE